MRKAIPRKVTKNLKKLKKSLRGIKFI